MRRVLKKVILEDKRGRMGGRLVNGGKIGYVWSMTPGGKANFSGVKRRKRRGLPALKLERPKAEWKQVN